MAVAPLAPHLQSEVDEVTRLRQILHDAYIVEQPDSSTRSCSGHGNGALEVHRTVDGPTLTVLKAPNYPFTLCEEAPPSYVPPRVPLDVEADLENMKAKVMAVQNELLDFVAEQQHSRRPRTPEGKPVVSKDEVIDFLEGSVTFSDLAWEVSSMHWFFRWVLSHSVSQLWNAKDQLEYVLRQDGLPLPTVQEMEDALKNCPFADAVSLVDRDRQAVVALERRRLRSVSRTFRERLPSAAITAATSSYLSPEEKYMYQEFYNQSEHLLLLLNHKMLSRRASRRASTVDGNALRGGAGSSRSPSHATSERAMVAAARSTTGEELTAEDLSTDALTAFQAEHDVIKTLMETIRERRKNNVCFDVAAEEFQQSREAQISVYGCILSDMNLMTQHMDLVKEFLGRYGEWVRYHGFDTHDELMQILTERSGGSGRKWPRMLHEVQDVNGGHDHFIPPTDEWRKQQETQQQRGGNGAAAASRSDSSSAPYVFPKRSASSRPESDARSAGSKYNDPNNKISTSSSNNNKPSPTTTTTTSPKTFASAYFSLLQHVDRCAQKRRERESTEGFARQWMLSAVHYTVIQTAQRAWSAKALLLALPDVEGELLEMLRANSSYKTFGPYGSALVLIVQQLLTLSGARHQDDREGGPRCLANVRVALHAAADGGVDMRKSVELSLTSMECTRWGAVLDALWFQCDPTCIANGGLLLPTSSNRMWPSGASSHGPAGFLSLERVTLPTSVRPSSGDGAMLVLHYYIDSPEGFSSANTLRKLVDNTASSSTSASTATRYTCARRALAALSEVEAKGLLASYACRIAECDAVNLCDAMYGTFNFKAISTAERSPAVVMVALLPPAALELQRIDQRVGSRSQGGSVRHTCFDAYDEPVNFSSIGMLIASLLEVISSANPPVLKQMYMMAESTREQAQWEVHNSVVPKSFMDAKMHPSPMRCETGSVQRAMSIQRNSSVMPQHRHASSSSSSSARRFVAPLLRHLDDHMASVEFHRVLQEAEAESVKASQLNRRSDGLDSTPSRRTVLTTDKGRDGGNGGGSPSPSAVYPARRK